MSLLPTATYGGATEPLYAPAGSVKTAEGPAGAVQYTDGAGNFLGNNGLVYDGVSKLENTPSGNSLDLNDGSSVVLTADTLALDIAGTPGTPGYVLTSNGTIASWQPSGGGGGVPNTWALYPATNNVDIANFNITNANRIETGSLITPGIGSSAVGPGPGITCASDFIMPNFTLDAGNIDMTVGAGLGNITNVTSISGTLPGGGLVPNLVVDGTLSVATLSGSSVAPAPPVLSITSPTDFTTNTLTNVSSIAGVPLPGGGIPNLDIPSNISLLGNTIDRVSTIFGEPPAGGGIPEVAFGTNLNLQGNDIENIATITGVPPALGVPGEILVNADLNMAGRFIQGAGVLSGIVLAPGQPITLNVNNTVLTNLRGFVGSPSGAGVPTVNTFSSVLDNLAGIDGAPGPGGVRQVTFNRSEILEVSTIQGVPPLFVPGPRTLNVDGNLQLLNNNILGANLIAGVTLRTTGIELDNLAAPGPAVLTLSPGGTILNNGLPLIYTGRATVEGGDVGQTSFTVPVNPAVSANSIVIATIQVPDQPGDQNVWLINTVPGPGTLTFNLAAPITAGSQLVISWLITLI